MKEISVSLVFLGRVGLEKLLLIVFGDLEGVSLFEVPIGEEGEHGHDEEELQEKQSEGLRLVIVGLK